jgi:hypothetical protein
MQNEPRYGLTRISFRNLSFTDYPHVLVNLSFDFNAEFSDNNRAFNRLWNTIHSDLSRFGTVPSALQPYLDQEMLEDPVKAAEDEMSLRDKAIGISVSDLGFGGIPRNTFLLKHRLDEIMSRERDPLFPMNGFADLTKVTFAHEVGHLLGAVHTPGDALNIMYPTATRTGLSIQNFSDILINNGIFKSQVLLRVQILEALAHRRH